VVKRLERFDDAPLGEALEARKLRAAELLALDAQVSAVVEKLRENGLQSPYLRQFVVARINPLRFVRQAKPKAGAVEASPKPPEWAAIMEKMRRAVEKFDVTRIHAGDLAQTGGAPEAAEGE
jgi:ParB family chromosome partitioning protein